MASSTPWDLPLLSNFNHSNLHCFLESITPTVPSKLLPKSYFETQSGFLPSIGKDGVECFSLSDVWKFYVEKSAYGTAVPILLNDGDTVVQCYSPSLSAIQIYTTKPSVCLRFESDSRIDDNENDKMSLSMSMGNKSSSSTSETTSDDTTIDHEGPSQTVDRLGHLYCQYNETLVPFERVPFTSKVNELAKTYPGLMKFKSMDLSPYSWIAIAWYPIYQIPVARNVKELSTSFLTYHPLSSSFQGITSTVLEEDDKFQCNTPLEKKCGGEGTSKGEDKDKISLWPFAVATYKMFGELWMNPETSDKEIMMSYQNAAHSWLKQLGFQHNDFNFFLSRFY